MYFHASWFVQVLSPGDVADLHDLKVGRLYIFQFLQVVVIPSFIRGTTNVETGTDVCEYDTVFFHCLKDHLILRGKSSNHKVVAQSESHTEWCRYCAIVVSTIHNVPGR